MNQPVYQPVVVHHLRDLYATYNLGHMYEIRWAGFELSVVDRLNVALDLFLLSANQGCIQAAFSAAKLYAHEILDEKALALKWYVYTAFLNKKDGGGVKRYDRIVEEVVAILSLRGSNPT
ncbi:MAG: hypothetical protein P1U34_01395 [Coxiellaceae bacterium]|nr:hypothetical protein [Coxiellaceae bacterium]